MGIEKSKSSSVTKYNCYYEERLIGDTLYLSYILPNGDSCFEILSDSLPNSYTMIQLENLAAKIDDRFDEFLLLSIDKIEAMRQKKDAFRRLTVHTSNIWVYITNYTFYEVHDTWPLNVDQDDSIEIKIQLNPPEENMAFTKLWKSIAERRTTALFN